MSKTYSEFRISLYDYHRNGLDIMSIDIKQAKNSIANTLSSFDNL